MNARDELAELIRESRIRWATDTEHRESQAAQADAILAAGYSKARTITTIKGLDSLPVESVVLSDPGNVYVKDYDLDDPSAIWWVTVGAVSEFQSNRIALPATVLYEPTP